MNIDDLTIKQAKELFSMFEAKNRNNQAGGLNTFVGKKVIIRTYSAGVFFGKLEEKADKEVILSSARRLWYWKTANDGVSLSDLAAGGVSEETKVCEPVDIWLEAIEIIPCSDNCIKSIESKPIYKI